MFKTTVLVAVAVALVLSMSSATALAQDTVYSVTYYANAHNVLAPDETLRFVNDGNVSDAAPAGNLWASIYVFDANEELQECCSCGITPNGYLALSVNNLTANPLTPVTLTRGVIKVLSTSSSNPAAPSLNIGIRGWITHIQKKTNSSTNVSYATTEQQLTDSTLGAAEFADLAEDCGVLIETGSGHGICSCADSGR